MKIIFEKDNKFEKLFQKVADVKSINISSNIDKKVNKILNLVKFNGDKALVDLTNKFDKSNINKNALLVNKTLINKFARDINTDVLNSFKIAIKRVKRFHKKQYPKNYKIKEKGIDISLRWKPIDSAGLYIPGGKASYPSSLIMNIIPAQIAGVKRIVVVTPGYKNTFSPYIMALLKLLNINEVYRIGGAQAIGALAFGTETIKPVDKIFGPGNAYVSSAKKQVFGKVGIDLIAGPSEIVVVADHFNNPDWIAADLMAQAEHDESSKCILITDSKIFAMKVMKSIKFLKNKLSKKYIINKSLDNFGYIVVLKNLDYADKYINQIAPEHLHLQSLNSKMIYSKINNVGAVFIGKYSVESFGDYIIGTNHILPTNRNSRFASGLGVLDFMKRNSCVKLNKKGFKSLSQNTKNMAQVEGLEAHKLSVQIREE